MATHTVMVDTSRLLEFNSKKADHSTRNTEKSASKGTSLLQHIMQ